MKLYLRFTLCAAIMAMGALPSVAAESCDKSGKPCLQQSAQPQAKRVTASYFYSSEASYIDIKLDGSRLSATYLPTTWKEPYHALVQSPHYRDSDLKRAEVTLSKTELQAFVHLVKSSGFLKLEDVYEAKIGRRYYPITVTVELDGKSKKVEYRSGPPPQPKAFIDVGKWLRTTAAAKFKHFPAAQ